jgi:uncharacterized RDD family membrane protein YckC
MSGSIGLMSAPVNPFAPPTANIDVNAPLPVAEGGLVPATRMSRLGGSMLDGLLFGVALVPAIVIGVTQGALAGASQGKEVSPLWWVGASPLQILSIIAWIALIAYQAYLVTKTGQSIGKRVARTRIVRVDGGPAGFVKGVLLRGWLFGVFSMVPAVGRFIGLADALFIFGGERRCLHDRLAGTRVVVAQQPLGG